MPPKPKPPAIGVAQVNSIREEAKHAGTVRLLTELATGEPRISVTLREHSGGWAARGMAIESQTLKEWVKSSTIAGAVQALHAQWKGPR